MPHRNGREVYDIIHKNNPAIPILFISGHTGHIISDEMIKEEGLNFLQKPIDFDTLTATITRLIGQVRH
jgi:FixJ family two-component response regulator